MSGWRQRAAQGEAALKQMWTAVRAALVAALAISACEAPARGQGAAPALHASGASLFAMTPDRQWSLPNRLKEISGLAVTADGRLLAHGDEHATIHALDINTGEITKSFTVGQPAIKGDFEAIAIAHGDIYLMASNGRMLRFREGADGASVPSETIDTGLADICEVEGLAWRRASDSLIIACKTNYAHAMRKTVALYAWSLRTRARSPTPWLAVREKTLADAAGVAKFHPSEVAIDPATGRIILLAGREQAMVELDPNGAVRAARRLGPVHGQPEGAAIMPDGGLVISDEATDTLRAQLTRYPRIHG